MKQRFLLLGLSLMLLTAAFAPAAYARDELKNTDPQKYYILLDLNNQIVTVFGKDANGDYTKVVRRFICTSGRTKLDPEDPEDKGTPTPRGVYLTGGHERFGKFAAFGATYARYWTQVVGGVYFHSIMYTRRDINTLQGGAYGSLGRNISHGCVRLYVEDAKWLYYHIPLGTTIRVSTSEPSNPALKKALKYSMSFKDYNAFQKRIYDNEELPNLTAWVVVDGAKVRTGNGSNDRALFSLKEGDEVEVLQIGDPWNKVKYNNREGYIKNAFVTLEKGVMQSKPDADIIKSTVYLFSEPSEKSTPLVKVPYDTSIKILEETDETWIKIQYEYYTGYLKKSWVIKGWGLIRE